MIASSSADTYTAIAARRIDFIDEHLQGLEDPPFTDPYLFFEFTRDDLINLGLDATFVDYVVGYQSYLNNLQAAGLVSGVTYSSNQYGGFVVSIPGAGEMIGGDQYNDGLPGTDLDDVVIGFNGADLFATSNGQDRYYGLGGRDMVDYVNETAGIVVQIGVDTDITRNWEPLVARNRMLQFVQDEHSAQDVLIDVEVVLGSSYVDMLEITTTEGWSLASEIIARGATQTADVAVDAFTDLSFESFVSYGDVIDLEGLTADLTQPIIIGLGEGSRPDGAVDYGSMSVGASSLTVADFTAVIGSGNVEHILGNQFSNQYFGFDGDDIMVGGLATDWLVGGDGDDRLYGGTWAGLDGDAAGTAELDFEDDGHGDWLIGGTGFDTYYASDRDIIVDADYHSVDDAATAGSRFVAEGNGQVYFDKNLLDGGVRVDFSEWWDYAPHPDLGIYWYEPDPNDPNRLYYIQRELLKGGSAETGLLLYRVMNATTVDSQGRPVSEWLLIVELAGAGQAISIAGVDYTPGVGIADGFLGIPTAAQSQQLTLTALDMQTSEAVPMGVLEASELGDYLVALDRSDQPFLERTSDNLGLEQSGVITVETGQGSLRGSRAGADQSSGETLSLASAVETSLAVAAKGPGGGGGGDPEPEPPEAGSGFMGIGIVNPEPAPDSAGDDNIRGGKDNDTLIAGAGNVTLKGAGGDDFLEGGAGADVLDGGSGIDTISYASSNSGVQVQLFNGAASGGHAQGDVISNVEHVTGSGFADNLYRDAGDNHLIGLFGNDYFESRGGSDKLDGALETMPSDSRG